MVERASMVLPTLTTMTQMETTAAGAPGTPNANLCRPHVHSIGGQPGRPGLGRR